jgi:nucleotide-binding universal stress UspA family protein
MTNPITRGAVVCGVDRSPASRIALTEAAQIARLEHRPLHIVHSERPPVERVADDALSFVRTEFPGLGVHATVGDADPRQALGNASSEAFLIVVGSRGSGGFHNLRLGSVSQWVAQHATCPTLVVRPSSQPDAPVLLGTDTTAVSADATEFAFAQAALRSTRLVVVHCFDEYFQGGYGLTGVPDDDLEGLPDQRLAVSESIAGLREKYPDVEVELELGRGSPAAYLARAAHRARLLVVGSRQRSSTAAFLTGSVSRSVVEHAPCSVAVVPARH